MKYIFLIFIALISLLYINSQDYDDFIEGEFNVSITKILSKEVSTGGYLFLETDGYLIPSTSYNQENYFYLSIMNDEDKKVTSLFCFFYQFEKKNYRGPAKIACDVLPSLKTGKYHLCPLQEVYSFLFFEIYYVNIPPYNISESFNIINTDESYFYSLNTFDISFYDISYSKTIRFDLFDSQSKEMVIYLDDTPITCQAAKLRMNCSISALQLPQSDRYKSYNVYIKDSEGNKRINQFIYPINIKLNYIEKKTLKIKVTKLLTNCLTYHDMIIFDTSDDTLGNVLYSKEGFLLKVKKEDLNEINSETKSLMCSFHKHPGETTKIGCEAYDLLEDGIYSFEEYISDGPLEDEDDRISPMYKIVVPTFKSNNKFIYSSNRNDEHIFDFHFREKIVLNFKNKEDVLDITLHQEKYTGQIKYYLGNSQVDCYPILNDYINCGVKGTNFEKSDIYYLERLNILEERERLYMVPPFEVTVSWDK